MLSNNPNKTKSIEQKWNNEITKRFNELIKQVKSFKFNKIIKNSENDNSDEFLALLLLLVTKIFLTISWQEKYQIAAYEQTVTRYVDEIKKLLTKQQAASNLQSIEGGILFNQANINELEFLKKRAGTALKKWISVLISDVDSIIHDSFGRISNKELTKLIIQKIKITEARARVIATTETNQAAQRAVIIQAEQTQLIFGEEISIRWITMRDSRVRHLHAMWHGQIMTKSEALSNLAISPWNCRCALKPVIKKRIPARKQALFEKERKQLLLLESKNK